MRTTRAFVLVIVIVAILLPAIAALAQGDRRINQDFNAPLKDILQVLKKIGNLGDFTIPEGYGDKILTVSVVDKTPSEAFTQALDAAGLVAINDGGTLVIKPKASEKGPREAEPVRTPAANIIGREPPRPVRTDAGSDVDKPTTTAAPAAASAADAAAKAKKDQVYRLIVPNYMNLQMLADMLGGSSMDENNYLGNNSSNGNGNGNNGNSGNNNGNNGGYGNNSNNGNRSNTGNRGGYSSSGNRGY